MNETWKKRWCDALESGQYPQATGALRTKGGFCCLGVIEDLVLKDAGEEWVERTIDGGFEIKDGLDFDGAELRESTGELLGFNPGNRRCPAVSPDKVREILGQDRLAELHYQPGYGSFSLAGLNDNGASFKEIAAIIRSAL